MRSALSSRGVGLVVLLILVAGPRTTLSSTEDPTEYTDTSTETPGVTASTVGETATDAASTTVEPDTVTESPTSSDAATETTLSGGGTTSQAAATSTAVDTAASTMMTTAAVDTAASTTMTTAAVGTAASTTMTTAAVGTAASTTTTTAAAGDSSASAMTTTTAAAGGTATSTTTATSSFPSNETTAAISGTTVASNSTTVASNSTTVASNSTTASFNSTTTTPTSTKTNDYKLNVKIDKDVSTLNITDKTSEDYIDLKALVESSLFTEFSKNVKGLNKVEVEDMRSGSLIIDFRVIVDTDVNPDADSSMVVAVIAIKTSLTIGNDTYNVTSLTYNSVAVSANSDLCTLLTTATPCQDNKKCVITSSGVPQCQSEDDGGPDIPLIVGLSVGLPLLAAVIVVIIVAVWYKKKYTKHRRVNSRMDE